MSELNLNTALSPELPGVAGIGARDTVRNTPVGPGRGTTGAPGVADPARPDGSTPPDPFSSLLAGFLQGAQSAAPVAEPTRTPGELLYSATTAGAAADPLHVVALPASAAPTNLLSDAGSASPSLSPAVDVFGNVLPATGKILPPATPVAPGDLAANLAPAANTPAPEDTSALAETRAPAGTRAGVSLADLAYARQLNDAPGLATTSTSDAIRSAAAVAFAGRATGPARAGAAEMPSMAPAPDTDLALALNAVTGADPAPVSTSTDALALRLSTAELLRNTIIPGAGAELAGRQLAAFAAGDESSGARTDSAAAAAAAGGNSSASLLRQLGSTTLPGLQPLGDGGTFSAGLADRLLMLGGPGAHSARLKLYPEHLGELKVDIRIDDGSAEVRFATTTSQAREAIEASLPRLRELFAEQGITLARAEVDAGTSQPGNPGSDQQRRTAGDWSFERDSRWPRAAMSPTVSGAALTAAASGASRLLDVWA